MQAPSIPADEAARLRSLYQYGVLDTEGEQAFDDLILLATQICDVPMALITLVDTERQWFKAKVGIDICETPRKISFCGHAVLADEMLVIEDAERDPRFVDNPLVTGDPRIRFYAGAPLTTPEGHRIGTLCVLDHAPRRLQPEQKRSMLALARQAVALLELRRKSELLERRDQRRSRLFSVVSHDLRTAFTGLIGHASVLTDDPSQLGAESIRHPPPAAIRQAREALRTAEDLLAWARAEMGSVQFRPVVLDVAEVLDRCVDLLAPLAEQKSINIQLQCERGLQVRADETLLTSMMRNLLANAIKFSPEGEKVQIGAADRREWVVVEVRDHGAGMSEQQISALERGEAVNTTMGTAGEKGTGLGLLTTRHFAERHGGFLKIVSEDGTRARLHIPK